MFLQEPDPLCDLDYVPNTYREHKVDIALVNTFDFYGQGAAVLVKKFE
jgi:3-oxoacyl-[acyl-carrier-protein] synthase II